ncbi:hypothetical protein M7I_6174 [Glarea lozoyensis 74030]|uniref:Uncharacterized protein n=1 Tax=Glarea lozoyensis (strain ATCC 74030 / MF5533) TaxID=1104152 RepID=H0ETV3_GLAL7|nr:hypothetical protein M7I_6174 [Glarea lozoyensis 74030]
MDSRFVTDVKQKWLSNIGIIFSSLIVPTDFHYTTILLWH